MKQIRKIIAIAIAVIVLGTNAIPSTILSAEAATTYKVSFNGNGGKANASYKMLAPGAKYGTLPSATRSGYKLKGWYTSKIGGSKVTAATVMNQKKAHTLYAQWIRKTNINYKCTVAKGGSLSWKKNGLTCGSSSKAKYLKELYVKLTNKEYSGSVTYTVYSKGKWTGWKKDGKAASKSKGIYKVKIKLTGNMAKNYSIYYRVKNTKGKWTGWYKDGQSAGSSKAKIIAVQVKLTAKGGASKESAPNGSTSNEQAPVNSDTWDQGDNNCNHVYERKKIINQYALIVDPDVKPNLFSRPLGAYCLTATDDPYQGSDSHGAFFGGTTTVHTGKYYIGNMKNDHIFRTINDEDIDINSLDWYCMHVYNYSLHDICKKCGYFNFETSEGVSDLTVFDPWTAIRNNDKNCTCFEFGKQQYGVIFFPNDNNPNNEIEIPYSRCKHENAKPYVFETDDPFYDMLLERKTGYAKCEECGAILSTCDHTDTVKDVPRYEKFKDDTTAHKVTSIYCKHCKICVSTEREAIPDCSHKNTYEWTADEDKYYGCRVGTMCEDCGYMIYIRELVH